MTTKLRMTLRPFVAALVGAVLVTAGCGTTRSENELRAARPTGEQSVPTGPLPAAARTASNATVPIEGTGSGAPTAVIGASPHATSSGAKTAAQVAGRGASSIAPVASQGRAAEPPASAAASPGGTAPAPGSPTTPAPATPVAPAPGGPKAPIVLGSIGSDSGVLGQILLGVLSGAKAWATDVNARGGLNGHPVKVIFADDGGEPARALALAKRMVDQDGAVAFYAERGPGTAQAVTAFLEERKIPLIGGCSCSVAVAKSPMSFQVGGGGDVALVWAHTIPLLTLSNVRTVSLIYCRESPSCKAGRDHMVNDGLARQAGIEIVHEAQVTITAPDYTAEALAARNAGAEGFIAFMDNFSVTRLARAAHRQDWYPKFSVQYTFHDERALQNGGKDVEGFLVGATTPHWTSPKLNDFRGAMQRFVPNGVLGSFSEAAWAAGKMLEKIATGFLDRPTSADFLKGLYALDAETLGGLMPPLTYLPGQGSDASNYCVVPMRVEGGKFVPKDGDNFSCAPGWQPVKKK